MENHEDSYMDWKEAEIEEKIAKSLSEKDLSEIDKVNLAKATLTKLRFSTNFDSEAEVNNLIDKTLRKL